MSDGQCEHMTPDDLAGISSEAAVDMLLDMINNTAGSPGGWQRERAAALMAENFPEELWSP